MQAVSLKEIRALAEKINADTIGRRKNGNFLFRKEFFYTHGVDSGTVADRIKKVLEKEGFYVMIVDHIEIWAPFKGGASTSQSSHWRIELEVMRREAVIQMGTK